MPTRTSPSPDRLIRQSRMQHLSAEQDLLPWEEVTERWNQKSGQKLTRGRVCQIARRAHEKLRERLQTVAGLVS